MGPSPLLAAVDLREYPGAIPGAFVALVIALAVMRSQGVDPRIRRRVAAGLVLSLGLVLAVTLTPGGEAFRNTADRVVSCDLSRLTLLGPVALTRLTDESLNVYLFIPLGVALAFLPASRWGALCVLGAILLPIVIEMVQAEIPALGRVCQSGDVIDNWTGLALGLLVGAAARLVLRAVATRSNEA